MDKFVEFVKLENIISNNDLVNLINLFQEINFVIDSYKTLQIKDLFIKLELILDLAISLNVIISQLPFELINENEPKDAPPLQAYLEVDGVFCNKLSNMELEISVSEAVKDLISLCNEIENYKFVDRNHLINFLKDIMFSLIEDFGAEVKEIRPLK